MDYSYFYTGICGERGEKPPKRGRGIGRGLSNRSPQNVPASPENSPTNLHTINFDRGRDVTVVLDESQKTDTHPNVDHSKFDIYPTSSSKDRKGQNKTANIEIYSISSTSSSDEDRRDCKRLKKNPDVEVYTIHSTSSSEEDCKDTKGQSKTDFKICSAPSTSSFRQDRKSESDSSELEVISTSPASSTRKDYKKRKGQNKFSEFDIYSTSSISSSREDRKDQNKSNLEIYSAPTSSFRQDRKSESDSSDLEVILTSPTSSTRKDYKKRKGQNKSSEFDIYSTSSISSSRKDRKDQNKSNLEIYSAPSTSSFREDRKSVIESSDLEVYSTPPTSSSREVYKNSKAQNKSSDFDIYSTSSTSSSRKDRKDQNKSNLEICSAPSTSSFREDRKGLSKSSDLEVYSTSPTFSSKEVYKDRKGQDVTPEEIGVKFPNKSLNFPLPKRPRDGHKGRPIKVISNCYPIKFPTGYAYHYDIEIFEINRRKVLHSDNKKYRCLNTKRNRQVISFLLQHNDKFKDISAAFDGRKNLLTRKELKQVPFTFDVMLPNEHSNNSKHIEEPIYDSFRVEIKALVSRINLDSLQDFYDKKSNDMPQEAIMAIEIILRHNPCLNFTPIGRSFFSPPDVSSVTPFGGGLEVWFGYHQSIRLSQWKPTVNMDVSATTFWKAGPVLDLIAEIMNLNVDDLRKAYIDRSTLRQINRRLRQRLIRVTHLQYGRKYRVVELSEKSASQEMANIHENGKTIQKTVAQFFKDTYGRNLMYENLPCIRVQPLSRRIFIPIEVCELVEGQHYKGELSTAQKTKMIGFSSNPPNERFKKIQDVCDKNFGKDKTVKDFGLDISYRPLTTEGRILDPPNLVYKDRYDSDKTILPCNGTWNVRETQFLQSAKISNWVLLSFQSNRYVDALANQLVRIGRNLGLQIRSPEIVSKEINCDKVKLFNEVKKRGNTLAVVVLPTSKESDVEKKFYAEIKKSAEITSGLVTQCIKAERLRDMDGKRGPQIATNLCLKINAKLGGENYSLLKRDIPSIMCSPVIIIGADVNHPPPTQLNQPSIAACVGSLDSFGKRFAVSIRAQVNSSEQKRKVEKICDLKDMVRDLLLAFYSHTRKKKPEKIIYYRDGVSEGELATVKNEEIVSIRKACRSLGEDYEPGITAIVVQKRHHVRFKPQDRRDGAGKCNNIPPGTVIDTEVTHPVNFDFFLCSQYGLQGTSRPSHYLVLEDDNDFSADDLQKLTYYMCYMYVRCTKSISIPAPVAYADLVAYRARQHLDCKNREDSKSSARDCSKIYRLTQEDVDAIQVVKELKDSMYFV